MSATRTRSLEMIDTEKLWESVVNRDEYADSQAVFGVTTTGIFCRPTCPAKRPKKENVRFFKDAQSAMDAGFRACKRCHPVGKHPDLRLVENVRQVIEEHIDERLTLARIGEEVGLSPYHVQRVFKRVTGISPTEYLRARRIERFKEQARNGSDVTTGLYDAGFGSSSVLYEDAPAHLGMTPGEYQRGGLGMEIRYAISDSPLGRLLVGTTPRGVCAVSFGKGDDELIAALQAEYPHADIAPDEDLGPEIKAIVAYLQGELPDLDLPLDVRTTAFRWRVWQELRRIPAGETRSYAEIARAIGQPTATRAVAQACASNPAALAIPCHRVVRSDGEPGGYRWGADAKLWLLERERHQVD